MRRTGYGNRLPQETRPSNACAGTSRRGHHRRRAGRGGATRYPASRQGVDAFYVQAFTAARERSESRALGDKSRAEDFPLTNFGELGYVGWGGGVPIAVDGEVIGAVGVSGLPETDDMELARWAVAAFGDAA